MALGWKYQGDVQTAIREFLKLLLKDERIQAVLVPTKMEKEGSYTHVLTKREKDIDCSTPIPPVMPLQGARVLSKLTKKGPLSKPVAAVLRPCELRAARELDKINQVVMDSFVTISYDCPGVYSTKNYLKQKEQIEENFGKELNQFSISNPRPLCSSCELFTGELADFEVQFANMDTPTIVARSERAESILKELNIGEEISPRDEDSIKEIAEARKQAREAFRNDFGKQVDTPEKLLNVLASCINCHNCRSVCPICFCRECFFDSDALKTPPHLYIERAERKGGLRFLPDTLLFHLGRMNHMSLSCVSCGTCEDACPNMVPVGRLFSLVSERTRAIFDYVPGVSEGPSPFLEYKPEELEEYEVPYHTARE
ncbi:formate dehydrogenase, beta subunit [Thermosulfidibacter takaii ABI70S6]|uniref:Formate dehydrogenase, beta subunit n=1 Tax=Thermosulfidibacter takaii (strain DSM 17441 / JCM 13301 / NBRC 103674 / ABI70S6) TaxID=1298851 RepID=A0A0S3QVE2_THET7|nr:4Fe-4S dicluster domain-containing protein [Thermosulfidibacter takaii]BAT72310.1 formate dehydrogenase, beta subunit [Thermosulfidibacter takaii ABI70S6]